ncbi:MAG TPA: hypothetical protein VHM26_12380, partial [Chitinophagaceae bacterium]|nr:hypothetical protein [Chitinophagaceae bacterium]
PDRIKLIHQNTVKWYAASDLTNISNRAELIYHYLKLGDIAAAEKLWTPDCIQPLIEAHIDFAEGNEARKWLEQRTVVGDVISEIAEQETIRRIKDALVRGNDRVVTGILQEKTRHAPDGMLLNYDALMMIKGKEFAKAYDLLSGTPSSKGLVTYQRKILLALAAMRIGEMNKCEELLLPLEEIATRSKFPAEYLLIRSARIRLNIDVAKEMKLFSTMMLSGRRDEDIVTRFLVPADVILPGLVNMLEENGVVMESFTSSLEIPYGGSGLHEFISLLNRKRRQSTQFDIEGFPPDTSLAEAERRWYVLLKDRMVKYGEPKELKDFEKTIIDLAVGGLKKWMLATQDFYLARITDTLNEQYLDINTNAADKILLAFIGALAALRGEQLDFGNKDESNDYYKQASSYGYNDGGTDHFIRNKISNTRIMRTPLMPRIESVRQALEIAEIHNEKQLTSVLQSMLKHIEETGKNPERFGILIEDLMPYPPQIFALLIFLLGPDPLEELCRFVMELPVDFEF